MTIMRPEPSFGTSPLVVLQVAFRIVDPEVRSPGPRWGEYFGPGLFRLMTRLAAVPPSPDVEWLPPSLYRLA